MYVVLEDLNIQGMMKNHHLAKSIQSQKWYYLRSRLIQSCHRLGIEVRGVSRFYPSSKLCHPCQTKHVALKLKDRVWQCLNPQCRSVNERDFNASLNLRDCPDYMVIVPEKKAVKRTRYKKVSAIT